MTAKYWPSLYDHAVLVRNLSPDAVIVESGIGVQRLWSAAALRKDNTCSRCWSPLAKGTKAYRPLAFGDDRPNRLCLPCMDEIRAGKDRHAP